MYPSTGVQGRGACFATSCSSDCRCACLDANDGHRSQELAQGGSPAKPRRAAGYRASRRSDSFGNPPTLQFGAEHLTDKHAARLGAKLTAWQCYQKLRNIYHARSDRGRELVGRGDPIVPVLPDPESGPARTQPEGLEGRIRLFRHKRHLQPPHRSHQLRYQATCRIARGCRNFTNYRLRCLLVADGHRPYRIKQANHA